MTDSAVFESLVDMARMRAASPPRSAYVFLADGEREEACLTWRDLDQRARAIAGLLQREAAVGERALLLFPPGLELVAAFFGCLYAGVVAVPAYPPRPRRDDLRLASILESAGPRVVLTIAALLPQLAAARERVPGLRSPLLLATDDAAGLPAPEEWREHRPAGGDLAFLQYTSGSTSSPKGVRITHANLLHNQRMIREAFRQSEETVVAGWLPLYHDMGLIGNVLQTLYSGGRCVLMAPAAFLQRPARWLEAIHRYRATTSGGPNFAYELCLRRVPPEQRAGLDLSCWEVAFNGAEPVRSETLARFAEAFAPCGFRRQAFYPCYGLAEATLFVAGGEPGTAPAAATFDSPALEENRAVASGEGGGRLLTGCGRPWLGQRVAVADPASGEELPPAAVGEIWVSGPSVADGYWSLPEESARTFGATLAGSGEGPFLRTGDLGFVWNGELFITGRVKDLIIIRGCNHYPQDLERTVEHSHPWLRPGGAAAFSIDRDGEERLVVVAEVERARGQDPEEAAREVRRAVAEEHELQIEELVLVPPGGVPRTSSGKIRRLACRAAYLDGSLAVVARCPLAAGDPVADWGEPPAAGAASGTALETGLAALVARAARLPVSALDPRVPLSTLGLDSLAVVELTHAAETGLGVRISPLDLLSGLSLRELAERAAGGPGPAVDREGAPRGDGPAELPLSHSQRAVWFVDRLAPGAAVDNLVAGTRVRSGLDPAALKNALVKLAARHPALRTVFLERDGELRQRVLDHLDPAVGETDVTGWSDREVRDAVLREAYRPLDLKSGPLLRIGLWRHGDGWVVWLAIHHIIADFVSLAVLLTELGEIYRAEAAGAPVSLPPPAATYADYVEWQERMLAGERGDELWDYWRRRLAGDLPTLDLPTDRPRPPVQSYAGSSAVLRLGGRTAAAVKALARSRGATLHTVMLAGYQALLHLHTGQPEVLVGSPAAGRPRREFAEVVGYFVNLLVLRADLADRPAAGAFLERVRKTTLEAFAHQDWPFALLVNRLQPVRDPSRSPIFQAAFVIEKAHRPDFDWLAPLALGLPGILATWAGLALESIRLPQARSRFDLTLMIADLGEDLGACLEYSTALFDASTADRLLRHYARLLERMAESPERAVGELPWLQEGERFQLLAEWNDTAGPEPTGSIQGLFEEQARRTPEAVAVEFAGERFTYGEVEAWANRLARRLRGLGVGQGSLVGVYLERCWQMVPVLLAILKAGGAYVPLDPGYPVARVRWILAALGLRWLVSQEELLAQRREAVDGLESLAHLLRVDRDAGDWLALPDAALPPVSGPEDLAYIIFTSGSTGTPKGVVVHHGPVLNLIAWINSTFGIGPADRVLFITSLCFDLSVYDIFGLLAAGAAVRVASAAELRDPERLVRALAEEPVTFWDSAPAALQQLVSFFPARPARESRLRLVFLSGDWIPLTLPDQVRDAFPGARVIGLGGGTEATVWSNFFPIGQVEPGWASIPYGRPIPNARYHVLDGALSPCPVGVAGDLYIAGRVLAAGYVRQPDLTAERFLPDPFGEETGGRMYRTGDRSRYRPDGNLEFLGRLDQQVKIRGFRIELGEIEAVLAEHAEVREAVVLARQDGPGGKRLVAYVVGRREPGPRVEELRRHLAERLPEYMMPAAFVLLASLPVTPNGKLDRKALPAPEEVQPDALEEGAPWADPLEETLAALWTVLLGRERIAPEDSFFDLGGDSLLATQLVSRLREAFGVVVPVYKVFESPTVPQLAATLRADLGLAGRSAEVPFERVPHQGRAPLSYAQERLWFLDQLNPGTSAYNIAAAFRLDGRLRPGALAAAVSEVARRHESLRTTFEATEIGVVQVIAPPGPRPLPLVDLSALPPGRRWAEGRSLLAAEAERPFDLARGPLLRILLLRLGPAEHGLGLAMHHIISDAWSLAVFSREVAALYRTFAAGEASALPEPPLQYADFALWQRRWLQGEALELQISYWKERLAGAPTVLELPADRPRPPVLTYRGAVRPVALEASLHAGLQELSRRQGVTLFMTLLAGFQVLLMRTAEREDLLVGTPIANRNRTEVEGLIGFFVNSLVLRTDLSGDPPFAELLGRVREAALGAYVHQDLPFERLVDELRLPRDLSRSPLFQVLFQLQRIPIGTLDLPGLTLTPLALDERTAKLDLVLSLDEREGEVTGLWRFNSDLFDPPAVARLSEHLLTLLRAAVADPGRRLRDLELLTAPERAQLLVEWNDTGAGLAPGRCFPELFAEQVRRTPAAVALEYEDLQETYAELSARADRLAHELAARGVAPGEVVALLDERGPAFVGAVLAVFQAGGAYLPLDPRQPVARLRSLLTRSGVRVVLAGEGCPMALPLALSASARDGGWEVLSLGELFSRPDAPEPLSLRCGPRDLAYVIYTSGSTGQPKGVMIDHRGMLNHLFGKILDLGITAADVVAQTDAHTFDQSIWQFLAPLLVGGRARIFPNAVTHDPAWLLAEVDRCGVTLLESVPSLLQLQVQHLPLASGRGAKLRRLVVSGEALPPGLVGSWLAAHPWIPVYNTYGATEVSDDATCHRLDQPPPAGAQQTPIGRPMVGSRVYVLDCSGRTVPAGVTGEVFFGGECVGVGYLGDPRRTAELFLPDPFASSPGGRLYRTGDLARFQTDGTLLFMGRVDHQVKVRGFRVEPGEIESALCAHPAVHEAVVLVQDLGGDPSLVAYLVPQNGPEPAERSPGTTALRAFLAEQLPEHMIPAAFITLTALPLTAHGKLDRAALPAPSSRPDLDRPFEEPGDDLERFLAGHWRQVLGIDRIGRHDDFFELGGNSIKAAILTNRLQQELGQVLYVVTLFDAPTLAALAAWLRAKAPAAAARLGGGSAVAAASAAERVDAAGLERLRGLVPSRYPALPVARRNPRAIFVLSPPRSGSTLLRVMLAGHPRLFAPPELELLSFDTLAERREALSGRNAFWLEGALRATMEVWRCEAEEARAFVAGLEERGVSTQELYRLLQEEIGGRLLVDKTTTYALDPEALHRAEAWFEEPFYLHLLRHPCAVIRSFEEARLGEVFFRWKHPFADRELAELIWTVSHQNIMEFLAEIPPHRQAVLRFEDLVGDPQGVLEPVCAALGLEYAPSMAKPYEDKAARMTDGLHAVSKMLGDEKFHQHQDIDPSVAGRWHGEMAENALGDVTRAVAEALGYLRVPPELTPIEPVAAGSPGPLPLSFAQERLWFLDRLEPGTATYNVPAAIRILGPLRPEILAAGLNEIVRRHAVLRTTFEAAGLRPMQRIAPDLRLPLPVIDLGGLPGDARWEEALRFAAAEAKRPFDLATGPLLRARLLRIGGGEHLVCLTLHHIVSDGWSMGVLIRELGDLYRAFSRGETSPLSELPIQYADYAFWQRSQPMGSATESHLAYWRERLAGLPVLQLPTDRPRPAVQTYRGATRRLTLEPALRESLAALAQREGASLFMVLLATFAVLLARATGQRDLAVGTPVANRSRAEIEGLIGFFVNTLVLRAGTAGEPTLRELLARVREMVLGAFAHQDVAFERLVEELRPERDLSYSPLFQVMLGLQNASPDTLSLPGLELQILDQHTGTAKFDLSVLIAERTGGLLASFEYAADLFDATTVERMAGHFHRLLASAIAFPDRPLPLMPLLTPGEAQQLLVEWNDTAVRAASPEDLCVHELFEAQARRSPERIAVGFGGQALSYGELEAQANRLAHHLRGLGVGPEILVGLCVERSPAMVVAMLGILKAGGAYVPLDPAHPAERSASILADAGVELLVTEEPCLAGLPGFTGRSVCLDRDRSLIAAASPAAPERRAGAENRVYVIYTSGSTGRPKGVELPHRAVVSFLRAMAARPGMALEDRLPAVTTLSFDIAGLEIYLPLATGARVEVLTRAEASDGRALAERIEASGATVLQATPATWRLLLDSGWRGAVGLRALCGGEALPRELADRLLERSREVWNLYGPTETAIWSSAAKVCPGDALISLGRPIDDTRFYVLDVDSSPVPVGVPGELCIAGVGLGRGYLGLPGLTAERFIPEPFSGERGARLYRTGDLVRWRGRREIELLGRLDHQVKVRGFRIELGEIEAALTRRPEVAQAVVAADGEGEKRRLVAYLVAHEGRQAPGPAELRAELLKSLPDYMVPSLFVTLAALSLTPNGKVDRKALPAPQAAEGVGEAAAPRGVLEELLADVWAGCLGLAHVGADDNFFDLGGHSLLATQVISRIRELLGLDLPLRALFQAPTVSLLAAVVEKSGRSRIEPPAPAPERVPGDGGPLPLSFVQERLWVLDQLEPGSPAGHIAGAVELEGPLDLRALGRGLAVVVDRHETLRTRFLATATEPVQVVDPVGRADLLLVDLREISALDCLDEAARLRSALARRPFDLARGPLLRLLVLRLADDRHVLALSMHHLISDAWSIGVLLRELGACYNAFALGGVPSLPELPLQYTDVVRWQRDRLETGALAAQLAYWVRHLAGAPRLELPTDRPRPVMRNDRGAAHDFVLPPGLLADLESFCRAEGVTLFMAFLAAFSVLMGRLSGETEIVVGSNVANRHHRRLEGLIGFLANTVALRTSLAGDPTVRELLARVRETVLEAQAHQDLPFDRLVEALQPERDPRYTPVFQVMLTLQEAAPVALHGLKVSPLQVHSGASRADLTLFVIREPHGLRQRLEYNTDLFERETIESLVEQLERVLVALSEQRHERVSALRLLSEAVEESLIGAFADDLEALW